jgi:MFS-type transporter involved in bile tolerance (Atg22 family)
VSRAVRLRMLLLGLLVVAAVVPALAVSGTRSYSWQLTPTGSTARLRGLSAVSAKVAWASGSLGTVLRTIDGGAT